MGEYHFMGLTIWAYVNNNKWDLLPNHICSSLLTINDNMIPIFPIWISNGLIMVNNGTILEYHWNTLWLFNSSPWYRWPIKIDGLPGLPIKNGWIFHGYVSHNQMVHAISPPRSCSCDLIFSRNPV